MPTWVALLRAVNLGARNKVSVLVNWAWNYVTYDRGVRIITPQGKVLGQLIVPEIVANVGFAEDGKTVYLTGSTSLYRLHANIPGEIPLYYRK